MAWTLDSSKVVGFTYNALITKDAYAGRTYITNPQREATLYGSFDAWASSCPDQDFVTVEDWFNDDLGRLSWFKCFNKIPVEGLQCGSVLWKAFIGVDSKLELIPFLNNVQTPYIITTAVPVSATVPIVGEILADLIGTQIGVDFKFRIVPENDEFAYSLDGDGVIFGNIPFRVLPNSSRIPPAIYVLPLGG